MTYQYSFKDCLEHAERINWRVEELIGPDKPLDFAKPFMPESLARTEALDFLSPTERLDLNQIRGHAYLTIFGLVEEFILPFVVDHARPRISGEEHRSRAYLEFVAEEAKHIHLFRRFREAFVEGFGVDCQVIGPAEYIGQHILSHPPLSVALLILHIEWMTQRHFTESMRDEQDMDSRFKDLLLHHWMEEQQHAQLDTLIVEEISAGYCPMQIKAGIEGYKQLGVFLDEGLKSQTMFDMEALERVSERTLTEDEREAFMAVQHQANRWTYIGSGMSHPNFLAVVERLSPSARVEFEAMAAAFS